MENLDEILSVKGLDAIYVGPSDLSISLRLSAGRRQARPVDDGRAEKGARRLQAAQACSPASIAARRPMPSR